VTPDAAADALRAFTDVIEKASWGERAFFVNSGGLLPSGAYFATIKTADGPNDRASQLNRDVAWRPSFCATRADFMARFGPPPARPARGGVVAGGWDFTAADRPTPHPVYGWMAWIAVLNPSHDGIVALRPLLAAGHALARHAALKRLAARRMAGTAMISP
jgi:hypothetical protein